MNKKLTIFVDTAAFVAFIKEDDTTHEKAKHLFHLCLDKVEAKGGEGCEGQCDGVKFQGE